MGKKYESGPWSVKYGFSDAFLPSLVSAPTDNYSGQESNTFRSENRRNGVNLVRCSPAKQRFASAFGLRGNCANTLVNERERKR